MYEMYHANIFSSQLGCTLKYFSAREWNSISFPSLLFLSTMHQVSFNFNIISFRQTCMLIRSVAHCISVLFFFVAHSVTPTADLLFQPLSVCLSKLLNFKVWPPQRSAWVIHMNPVWSIRACVCVFCVGTFVSEPEHLVSFRRSWSSFPPFRSDYFHLVHLLYRLLLP